MIIRSRINGAKKKKLLFLFLCIYTLTIDLMILPFWILRLILKGKKFKRKIFELENVRDGYEFEEYMAGLLARNGFSNVSTTKKSGDYGVDILAEKDGYRYAVQCKLYSQPVGLTAVQEVFAGKKYYNCHVAVVATNNTFTANAIELASKTGSVLWDGNIIKGMERKKSV